jgi:hypothetical protein
MSISKIKSTSLTGTFRVDSNRLLAYRLNARKTVLIAFFFITQVMAVISVVDSDPDTSPMLSYLLFFGILVIAGLIILFIGTAAERTVIKIDHEKISWINNGSTTTIALDEIGEVRDITNGFLIVRRGHKPEWHVYNDNFHEDLHRQHIIYVPYIIEEYYAIYNLARKVAKP